MDNSDLAQVEYYKGINKPQKAIELLESLSLNIENPEQIKHFILYSELLVELDRDDEALELIDSLRSNYPNDIDCLEGWVFICQNFRTRVVEAYQLTQELYAEYPDESWYPYIMASMCYHYCVDSDDVMLDLIHQALKYRNDEWTLSLGQKIFQHLKKPEDEKECLEALIASYPDTEIGQQTLVRSLLNRKKYRDVMQISLDAIQNYPTNEIFIEAVGTARDKLYSFEYSLVPMTKAQEFLDWLYDGERQSVGLLGSIKWLAYLTLMVLLIGLAIVMFIVLLPFCLTSDAFLLSERVQRKRTEDQDFKRLESSTDNIFETQTGLMIWNPESITSDKFIHINEYEVVFAENITAPPDEFIYGLDEEKLIKSKRVLASEIESVVISQFEVGLHSSQSSGHYLDLEFSDSETFTQLKTNMLEYGFKLVEKKETTKLSTIMWFFTFLIPSLSLLTVQIDSEWDWVITRLLPAVCFSNLLMFLFYRLGNSKVTWKYERE